MEIFTSGYWIESNYESLTVFSNDLDFGETSRNNYMSTLISIAFSVLLFLEFAEVETLLLDPKGSGRNKVKSENEKMLNEEMLKIEIVNSNWFKRIIRQEGFKVSGHFRLQKVGQGLNKTKLVWINEYDKKGYNLGSKLEQNNNLSSE